MWDIMSGFGEKLQIMLGNIGKSCKFAPDGIF